MDFFPLFVRLRRRAVTVIGGGAVAARKMRALLRAGARIKVIAERVSDEIQLLVKQQRLTLVERAFEDADIENAALVVAATDSTEVNRRIVELCRARNIYVNSVDSSDGDVIFSSLMQRGSVQVAVSTGGGSPVLARLLRDYIESCTPDAYAELARISSEYRARAKQVFPDPAMRRRFWEKVLTGRIASMVFAGRAGDAECELQQLLDGARALEHETGEVYLVGAGPGDPDLLTFKALRLMRQADVVVYDRLVSPEIMALLPDTAEKIYAGKERSHHTMSQKSINELLVRRARQGHRVLRLKGGDPFVFGRGGEEIETLLEQHIALQIVPGITAASGCAAYAGIPLTHRDFSHTCVFSTGHLRDGDVDLNWDALAQPCQTLIFYMGLQRLEHICTQLVAHGLPADTPAALITRGTMPAQKVLVARLDTLAQEVASGDFKAPTLVIVGKVVGLHEKLDWYRQR